MTGRPQPPGAQGPAGAPAGAPDLGPGGALLGAPHGARGGAVIDGRDLLRAAELALIDLDGCLAFDGRPHPAAAALLARLEGRYAILSNNSTHTPEGLSRMLARAGLSVPSGRILLAGAVMVDLLAELGGRPVFLLASPAIRDLARRRGVTLADEGAEVVALARDTTLTYDRVRRAVALLSRGAELVVSNPDLTHPGEDRVPIPETGALLALLQAAVPGLRPEIVGKPGPRMFREALARFGAAPERCVMIGDNPATDGAGARAAGLPVLLVGPGQAHGSIADLV